MHQRPLLELKDQVRGVAVALVLGHGVPPGLGGHGVLEFPGGHRNAVQAQDHVQGIAVPVGVADLARDGEAVGGVELLGLGVQAARRGEVGRPKQLAEALEPVAQHRQTPLMGGIERPAEIVQQGLFSLALLELGQVLPLFGLRRLDEGQQVLAGKRPRSRSKASRSPVP